VQDQAHSQLVVTPEAQTYLDGGAMPEKAVFDAIPADGGEMFALSRSVGEHWKVGFKKAMERKWIKVAKVDGVSRVTRLVDTADDTVLQQLQAVVRGDSIADKEAADLKKRKLVRAEAWKTFQLGKGPAFALERVKPATDLTVDMLQSGEWRKKKFKDYNFEVRRRRAPAAACYCLPGHACTSSHKPLC
jgi:phenylalanyl-tRNA synthetase alpha chain